MKTLDVIPLAEGDRSLCVIGLEFLQKAVKKARESLEAIDVDAGVIATRDSQCETLLSAFQNDGPEVEDGIPTGMARTLRVALKLEYLRAEKIQKDQTEMQMDTDETATRLNALDRLISVIDVAGLGAEVE